MSPISWIFQLSPASYPSHWSPKISLQQKDVRQKNEQDCYTLYGGLWQAIHQQALPRSPSGNRHTSSANQAEAGPPMGWRGGRWSCPFGRLGDPTRVTPGTDFWVWISADLGGHHFLRRKVLQQHLQYLRVFHHDQKLFHPHLKTFKICQHHFRLGKPKLSNWLLYSVHLYNMATTWKASLWFYLLPRTSNVVVGAWPMAGDRKRNCNSYGSIKMSSLLSFFTAPITTDKNT